MLTQTTDYLLFGYIPLSSAVQWRTLAKLVTLDYPVLWEFPRVDSEESLKPLDSAVVLRTVKEPGKTGQVGLPCSEGVYSVDSAESLKPLDSAVVLRTVKEPCKTGHLRLPCSVGVSSVDSAKSPKTTRFRCRAPYREGAWTNRSIGTAL